MRETRERVDNFIAAAKALEAAGFERQASWISTSGSGVIYTLCPEGGDRPSQSAWAFRQFCEFCGARMRDRCNVKEGDEVRSGYHEARYAGMPVEKYSPFPTYEDFEAAAISITLTHDNASDVLAALEVGS